MQRDLDSMIKVSRKILDKLALSTNFPTFRLLTVFKKKYPDIYLFLELHIKRVLSGLAPYIRRPSKYSIPSNYSVKLEKKIHFGMQDLDRGT